MYVKSPYPEVPPIPETNLHNVCFHRPDQAEWPADHTMHIDGITGRKRSYREFLARINDAAAALGAPLSDGGLGLTEGNEEIVAIMSDNIMVNVNSPRFWSCNNDA